MDLKPNSEEDMLLFAPENNKLSSDDCQQEFWKIIIADDEPEVHAVTKLVLRDFEFEGRKLDFISAYTGNEAEALMLQHPDTAIILLDVMMETDTAGLSVARCIRERQRNRNTRIILRTGQPGLAPEKKVILDYDINDYKEKTELTAQRLYTTVVTALRSYRDILTIQHLNEESETTQKEIIFTLGEIVETRSAESGYHVKRVAEYSKILALGYGMPETEAELIRMASPMHDVGKLGILDAILNKPEKLSAEEFEIMKSHAQIGYGMLKHAKGGTISTAALIAYQHHEKYNGTGYPNQLKGEEIHIYARITAIADVFDALGSDRVYKKAWELPQIIEFFTHERGEHFDPKLVDILFARMDEFIAVRDHYVDAKIF